MALRLNVDFSVTQGTGGDFGDLVLCNFTGSLEVLNGKTVAQALAEAEILLGGGIGRSYDRRYIHPSVRFERRL